MSARETVLDAFEELLVADGPRAATIDAVAARAKVSKGGVLYHFGSKEALVEGLAERLVALGRADAETMAQDPRGPSVYYVETSVVDGSPLDRALVATARLAQEGHPAARSAMEAVQHGWFELILDEVGDRAVARAIQLLGDGLYYNAALAGVVTSGSAGATEERAALLEVVARLRGQRATNG